MTELRRGEIVRIRDERWYVCRFARHAAVGVIEVRGFDRSNRGIRARFLLPFEAFERLPALRTVRIVSRRRWQNLARRTLAAAVPGYDSLRTLAAGRLEILPYQLEPALAVIRGVATRLLVADDVGLGKTVQAGLIVAETIERTADAHVLIVCPAALRDQWAHELTSRFGLNAAVFDSATLARIDSELTPGANPWAAHRLIVTSIDYVKRPDVIRALESLVWDLIVIDEAHRLSGSSDRRAASLALGSRARTLVMLSATPHSGDDDAFQRLCAIGDLRGQFPMAVFRRRRSDVGRTSSRRTVWLHVRMSPAERALHDSLAAYARLVWRQPSASPGARLAMIVLMRRASSSAAALAVSIERRLRLLASGADAGVAHQLGLPFAADDSDEEPVSALAAPGLGEGEIERETLRTILTLADEARSHESKLAILRRLLQRTGERAIVFTEYRDTLARLAEELAGFGCLQLHGGLDAAERRHVLQQFVSGGSRLLLATDAASEGLNLQEGCRLVIHLELPWTPVRLEQRVGRVDRIGQRRRVHQMLLVAAGTWEQSTAAIHVRERASRVRQTLAAMRPAGTDEFEMAEHVLGSCPPSPAADGALPVGVFAAELRAAAADEARRVTTARMLAADATPLDAPSRPFATAVNRGSRACWSFRVSIASSDDDLLWETVVGALYGIRPLRRGDAESLRRHFVDVQRMCLLRIEQGIGRLAIATVTSLQPSTLLAIAREKAIVAELRRHEARLAASLVQRPLFGIPVERETAEQRSVLDDVIARCENHLWRLSRRLDPPLLHIEPSFAAILR